MSVLHFGGEAFTGPGCLTAALIGTFCEMTMVKMTRTETYTRAETVS